MEGGEREGMEGEREGREGEGNDEGARGPVSTADITCSALHSHDIHHHILVRSALHHRHSGHDAASFIH